MRDASLAELSFAATYFDAFLDSQLDVDLTVEFSLLCAAAYYLSDNPGSARVVISRAEPPSPSWEGGLPWLVYAVLSDTYQGADDFAAYAKIMVASKYVR